MTAAEKVHYWMLKYEIANGTAPNAKEISAQLEMAIENENQTLSIADVSNRRELLLAYSEWWDKKYSPERKDIHRLKDITSFLSQ